MPRGPASKCQRLDLSPGAPNSEPVLLATVLCWCELRVSILFLVLLVSLFFIFSKLMNLFLPSSLHQKIFLSVFQR